MHYREIILSISSKDVQIVTDVASVLNFGGLYIEDYTDLMENEIVQQVGLVDEELLQKDPTKAVVHIYIDENSDLEACRAFLEERLSSEKVTYQIEQKTIDEEDYANSWKQYYKPLPIGDRIVVIPEWETYDNKEGRIPLILNPGMAFGSGSHETTSLCIETLQQYVQPGMQVLDVGCGSGILAVTALLCGAEHVVAVDIDPNATKVALENAEKNHVKEHMETYAGNLLDTTSQVSAVLKDRKFDVIVANIVADVIIQLSDLIHAYLNPNAYFIVSGIIGPRKEDVLAALRKNKLSVVEIREKRDWICIVAKA